MSIIRKLILIVFTFFYIFNPSNFTNFNLYYLLIAISALYSIFNLQDFKKIFLKREVGIFLIFNLYLLTYIFIVSEINDGNSNYRIYIISLLTSLLPCAFYIIREFSKLYEYNIDNLVNFISTVVIIQLFIVGLSLVIPELRLAILVTSRDPELLKISNEYGLRSFGLANGYTSTFPMFLGAFATFHMYYFVRQKKVLISVYHLTMIILLVIAIVLNARVGLLPILMFSVFLLFKKANRPLQKLQILAATALFAFYIGGTIEMDKYVERLSWAVDEINDLSKGEATGTFAVLQDMVFIPDSLSGFLLGTGMDIFGENSRYDFSSDIGPIKDLFVFGFINLMTYSFILFLFFKRSVNGLKNRFGIFFAVAFVLSLIAFYIKGAIFAGSEIVNLMLLLSIFFLYKEQMSNRASNCTRKAPIH